MDLSSQLWISSSASQLNLIITGLSSGKSLKPMVMQTLEISSVMEESQQLEMLPSASHPKDLSQAQLLVEKCDDGSCVWKERLALAAKVAAMLGYIAYLIAATVLNPNRAVAVWVISALVLVYVLVGIVWYEEIKKKLKGWVVEPGKELMARYSNYVTLSFVLVALLWFVLWLVFFGIPEPRRIGSFVGLIVFLAIAYLFSTNPSAVQWQPIAAGLVLQALVALFFLRTDAGRCTFRFLAEQVVALLSHIDAGSSFVFGPAYEQYHFAMKVLPSIIYVSAFMSCAYYAGVLKWLYRPLSWLLEKTLNTSPVESFNTVACIFSNQSAAPQHLKQLLRETTRSELFSVMVGGFGTASIGVMVAYIGLGIPVNHLIAASIMSAPAALAVAKLMFPETEKVAVKIRHHHIQPVDVDEDHSIFDAASSGGMAGLQMVASLAATIITFASLFSLCDAAVAWMLSMVDHQETGLEDLLSYVMYPIAWLIGIDRDECQAVGRVLGRRMVLSELVAFRDLSMKVPLGAGESCINGCLSDRSIVLATYALYGFANFGSLRIVMNALGKIAPDRKMEIYQQGGRALLGGTLSSFLTACVAAMLYDSSRGLD